MAEGSEKNHAADSGDGKGWEGIDFGRWRWLRFEMEDTDVDFLRLKGVGLPWERVLNFVWQRATPSCSCANRSRSKLEKYYSDWESACWDHRKSNVWTTTRESWWGKSRWRSLCG